jgi:hypothetical protein
MAVLPVCTPSPNQGTHGYITIVDPQGYPIVNMFQADGADFGTVAGNSAFVYNSGGPPLANGVPTQMTYDHARSFLGMAIAQGTISSTSIGDTSLNFSSAPLTLMPRTIIRLNGAANPEYVFVADSFVPSPSAVTIPLQSPVVYAGQTNAAWNKFDPYGPNSSTILPIGIGASFMALQKASGGSDITIASGAGGDVTAAQNFAGVVPMRMYNASQAERARSPVLFKPFNAQAVTASSANTPTLIWTPASTCKFRLMGYWFSTTNAAGLLFHDLTAPGSGGLLPIPSPIHPAGGIIQSPNIGNGFLSVAANNKLYIDATSATTLTGFVYGTDE